MANATGRQLADSGMDMAREAAEGRRPFWTDDCIDLLRKWLVGCAGPFALEEFREHIQAHHPDMIPPSPNAWGALGREATKREVVAPTGQYRPARSRMTHAHPVRLLVPGPKA